MNVCIYARKYLGSCKIHIMNEPVKIAAPRSDNSHFEKIVKFSK